MSRSFSGLAGRLAIAMLLVLLAAGSVLAAASSRPGPAAVRPAAETAAPTPADPSVTPEPTKAPKPTKAPEPARAPEAEDDDGDDGDGTPSTANLERIVGKLAAAGITTTTDELGALAAKVGLGGAVRVLLFADAAKKTPAEIVALFEAGTGWGAIARELKLEIGPGLGWVMGNGNGPDTAAKAERAAAKAERAAARAAAKAQRAQDRAERKAGN